MVADTGCQRGNRPSHLISKFGFANSPGSVREGGRDSCLSLIYLSQSGNNYGDILRRRCAIPDHDALFKALLGKPGILASFFRAFLPEVSAFVDESRG